MNSMKALRSRYRREMTVKESVPVENKKTGETETRFVVCLRKDRPGFRQWLRELGAQKKVDLATASLKVRTILRAKSG
jgi:hypothetical protein